MTTMATEPIGVGYLTDIPAELVVRAQQDLDYALRLLHRETRAAAIGEAGLDLTAEEQNSLYASLDQIANMSFQDALEALRKVGVLNLA
jgi:Tat protein secretion system quality control protein TatD with DNase activity